jgi:hypothetical protein
VAAGASSHGRRPIFFLSTLRACSTLLSRTRTWMAFRLFWLYAFVRPESEQYCSQPRLYALNQCSETVTSLANCIGTIRK